MAHTPTAKRKCRVQHGIPYLWNDDSKERCKHAGRDPSIVFERYEWAERNLAGRRNGWAGKDDRGRFPDCLSKDRNGVMSRTYAFAAVGRNLGDLEDGMSTIARTSEGKC